MDDFFLTVEELITLTGYRKKSLQIRHLARNGIRFTVNALGEPVVLRESIKELMCVSTVSKRKNVELNLPKQQIGRRRNG